MVQFDSKAVDEKATLVAAQVYIEVVGKKLHSDDINRPASHANENCNVKSIMISHIINIEPNSTSPEIA